MNLIYTVNDNPLEVYIYVSGNPVPIIYQPNWPNGNAWDTYNDADLWAQSCILSITDPDAPYAPAGPGLSGEPRAQ
jgi:hypothetical protein